MARTDISEEFAQASMFVRTIQSCPHLTLFVKELKFEVLALKSNTGSIGLTSSSLETIQESFEPTTTCGWSSWSAENVAKVLQFLPRCAKTREISSGITSEQASIQFPDFSSGFGTFFRSDYRGSQDLSLLPLPVVELKIPKLLPQLVASWRDSVLLSIARKTLRLFRGAARYRAKIGQSHDNVTS